MKKKVIIYLYNRLFDPLIQSNFWLYILDRLNDPVNPYQFHLITYEDPRFPLTPDQVKLVDHWKRQGLDWTPLTWSPGTALTKKLKDLVSGLWAVTKLRFRGYKHVVSLASVAGTFAYLYSLPLRLQIYLYQFEPHSEYAIDNRMWPRHSLQFYLSNVLERLSANKAKAIASGTCFMRDRLRHTWRVSASFFHIPTVVNDKKFEHNPEDRVQTRQQLGIAPDKWVLFYPGKFGDLYYREETAWMFRWLREECSNLHFLIVTPHKDEEVQALFDSAGVARSDYTIAHSDYTEIHRYYSASDFAVIAVPPGPSKCFISNIKVGEYLCAGLPFLITQGVSEDHIYAEREHVGVVVDDFVESELKKAWPQIEAYLRQDKETQREHCRKVGLEYRGFEVLNPRFKAALACLTESL